jgi:hypothetical protein
VATVAGKVEYDPIKHPREAEFLCQRGAVDREIAEFFNIQLSTFYYWRNAHPEFCEAMKVGKEIADDRVERSLYNRAVGYSYDSVKIMAVATGGGGGSQVVETPYVEHVPPDVKAAIRWLEARRPEVWRRSLALTGAKGGPIEVRDEDENFSGLDQDERAQLRTLLQRTTAEQRGGEG